MRTPEPGPVLSPPIATYPDPLPLTPLPDVLAYTGPGDVVLSLLIFAAGLCIVGWMVWANSTFKDDDR